MQCRGGKALSSVTFWNTVEGAVIKVDEGA